MHLVGDLFELNTFVFLSQSFAHAKWVFCGSLTFRSVLRGEV
jgi:hypothetical protein